MVVADAAAGTWPAFSIAASQRLAGVQDQILEYQVTRFSSTTILDKTEKLDERTSNEWRYFSESKSHKEKL